MSRSVVSSLRRPCTKSRWHPHVTQHSIRRWYSESEQAQETEEPIPEVAIVQDREQTLHLLRNLDQKHLSACRRSTDDIIRLVPKAKDDMAALPVTVQTIPEIPPYTIGSLQRITRHALPDAAEHTVAAAKHVREHLIDLQYQPYNDGDENSSTLFEREVANMTEEQKWERYNELKLQAEAQAARLDRKAREVAKKTEEMIARHKKLKGAPKKPMPSFGEVGGDVSDVDGHAFEDVEDMEIVTEGKGEEGWDAFRHEARAEVVEGTGWKDAEEAWVSPIRALKTDWKDSEKPTNGQRNQSKITEHRIRKHSSGSVREQPHFSRLSERLSSDGKEEESARAEQKRPSFEALKGSLESTVSKDKK